MKNLISARSVAIALVVAALVALFPTNIASAQTKNDLKEGYVQSLRSLYSEPDATSDTIGFIEPGEYVRLEHVNALVYRVFREGETVAAGFVVYPKIGPNSPLQSTVAPIRATSEEIATPVGETPKTSSNPKARMMWVHNFANIRLEPSTRSAVTAQLPPGTAVVAGEDSGLWTLVYKQNETVLEPSRALGYVHQSLLKSTKPAPQKAASLSEAIAATEAGAGQEQGSSKTSTKPERSSSSATALVNVNTANQRMLETLPRIGPVLAKRIIDYRESKGAFKRIEDLDNVKGIGEKTLERLRPYVTVGQ